MMKIAEAILGQMTAPVLVLHEHSHAIFANPAFYDAFDVDANALNGKSPKAVLESAPELSPLRPILNTALRADQGVEGVIVENSEKTHVYSMNSRRLTFEGRATDMILVELFNITREHERELRIQELNAALLERKAELERINQDLESFVHSASHDLRTPLRLVNRVAQLLAEGYGSLSPVDALQLIDSIKDSTEEVANFSKNCWLTPGFLTRSFAVGPLI